MDEGNGVREYRDRLLLCANCSSEFVFTADEQRFFNEKGFTHEPKRCKKCNRIRSPRGGRRPLTETVAKCASCGSVTTVPFKPTQGRPVLCRSCFQTADMTVH